LPLKYFQKFLLFIFTLQLSWQLKWKVLIMNKFVISIVQLVYPFPFICRQLNLKESKDKCERTTHEVEMSVNSVWLIRLTDFHTKTINHHVLLYLCTLLNSLSFSLNERHCCVLCRFSRGDKMRNVLGVFQLMDKSCEEEEEPFLSTVFGIINTKTNSFK